jgi:Bacterial Ig-like domain (group 2)/Matrixin
MNQIGRGSRGNRRAQFQIECLEDRTAPATFGVPWGDARNLTLSFVPDGTVIAGHSSTLFQTLNATGPAVAWQQTILKAFQTWAVNANINIGLVPDGGQPLGVAGDPQHDPRFGDIRIGAQPMDPGTLAISVPNDPLVSSTLSGDVLINSDSNFSDVPNKLFAAVLHEAGHVFGIGESTDPQSPMYAQYQGNTQLTAGDIASLQALYGARAPDPHEGSGGNDQMGKATTIQDPGGSGSYQGATPLIAYGDITTNQDADVYAFKTPNRYTGGVTIRLRTAGISLLRPHLTWFDRQGALLGDAQSTSSTGDVLTLHLNAVDPNTQYFIKVQGAASDVFGKGSYGVSVSFDSNSTVTTAGIDAVLRGPYQALNPNDLDAIFVGTANLLFNSDNGANDTAGTATQLVPSPGYARNSHYEVIGSIATPTDSDHYRIQKADNPPAGESLVLTVTARALDVNGTTPRIVILDNGGRAVAQQILANGAGMFTVQAGGLSQGGNYVIEAGPNTAIGSPTTGNYAVVAQFGTTAAQASTLATGTVDSPTSSQSFNLYVGVSQLMHLILSANAIGGPAAPGSAVQMTVTDASANVVYNLTASTGDTVSGAALFLTPGPYELRFTSISTNGAWSPPLAFSLLGEEISDPIGTVVADPTLTPQYTAPTGPPWFQYPGGVLTTVPFLLVKAATGGSTSPASLVSITVNSASPTLAMGASTRFTATGILSDHTTVDLTSKVSWLSSSSGVAIVTPTGLVTAVAAGESSIVASFDGVTGSSVMTVSPPPLVFLRSVSLGFAKGHMVSQIRLTLSGSVDIAAARTVGIYRLLTAGSKGGFGARNAGKIRIKKAVYDSLHNVVIITPLKAFSLARPVQLSIAGGFPGGLHDSFNRLIDGDHDGAAGGSALAVIRKNAVNIV